MHYVDKSEIESAVIKVYGDLMTHNGQPIKDTKQIKKLVDGVYDLAKEFDHVNKNNEKMGKVNSARLDAFLIDELTSPEQNVIRSLGIEVDGKAPSATDFFDSKDRVLKMRATVLDLGRSMRDAGKSDLEIAKVLHILGPMYNGMSK